MNPEENDRKSVLMIILSMLIFGSIGIFRRFIPVSSAFLAFFRGVTGGLFILVFMLVRRRSGKRAERIPLRTVLWFALIGALIGVNWMLLFEAYNYTTVATATLCYYMQPTIVMLLSPLVFHERLTAKKAACSAVAIAGMILVSGVIGGGQAEGNLRGILLGLGAAALYAAVIIMNKRVSGVDAYLKTTIQLLAAGIVMLPYMLLTGGFQVPDCDLKTVILLVIVGIVHTGIAYVLYFGSMDGLKTQSIAIFSYIDPVSALIFSAIFLNESLSAAGIIGAVMIIGVAVVSEIKFKNMAGKKS